MHFQKINMETWPRKEHFEHYLNGARCTYSATFHLNVTALQAAAKKAGFKTYPAQIYLFTQAVNAHPAFRMDFDGAGNLGLWDRLEPMYTVLNKETETFSAVYTPATGSFAQFHARYLEDVQNFGTGAFQPQANVPANVFNFSGLPWVPFTAFNLNLYTEGTYLLPIFTVGKMYTAGGETFLPVAAQVHHSVCDGLHLGRFFETLETLAAHPETWLF